MSYIVTRHYTEEFEITQVRRNFMKFDSIYRVRKDITCCELCDTPFQQEDNTNLAFIKAKKNHLICDTCTEEVVKGGAEVI